jgi:hypothetical protein
LSLLTIHARVLGVNVGGEVSLEKLRYCRFGATLVQLCSDRRRFSFSRYLSLQDRRTHARVSSSSSRAGFKNHCAQHCLAHCARLPLDHLPVLRVRLLPHITTVQLLVRAV